MCVCVCVNEILYVYIYICIYIHSVISPNRLIGNVLHLLNVLNLHFSRLF